MADFRFFITLLFSLALATQASSAGNTPTMALPKGDLNEVVRKGALISGAVVVGVQVRQASESGLSLTGYIPGEWRGADVCAKVVSADGLYEASGPYTIPAEWAGGLAEFPFPTKHLDLLSAMPIDGLGVLVSYGECGSREHVLNSITLWNASQIETVDVILNSFRADSVFAYIGDQQSPVRCDRVTVSGATAFDTKCRLQTAGVSGRTKVDIYRMVGGKPSQPTSIEIWFPGN